MAKPIDNIPHSNFVVLAPDLAANEKIPVHIPPPSDDGVHSETSAQIIKVESSILPRTLLLGSLIAAIGLAVLGYNRLTANQEKVIERLHSSAILWYVAVAMLTISAAAAFICYAPPATAGLALIGLIA